MVDGQFQGIHWDKDWKKPTLCRVKVTKLPLQGITQVDLVVSLQVTPYFDRLVHVLMLVLALNFVPSTSCLPTEIPNVG